MKTAKHILLVGAALGLLLSGCGDDDADSDVLRTRLDGSVKEFAVTLPEAAVTAGELTVAIANKGRQEHSLVLAQTELPLDKLPVKKGKVDSGKLEVVGKLRSFEPGATGTRVFKLEAGRYVLYCENEGHYEQGMAAELLAE